MKILSASQNREADAYTIQHEPIKSIDLMERASRAFVKWFSAKFNKKNNVAVVCGTGNNGGDGLAIARLLQEKEFSVSIFIVKSKEDTSEDFATNEKRLKKFNKLKYITDSVENLTFEGTDIIIDGIFGSGLSRPVGSGVYKDVIDKINNSKKLKVSVDIPSGLFSDKPSIEGVIVEANCTVTFQSPKLAFLFPENYKYVGKWHVVDIGLDKSFIDSLPSENILIEEKLIKVFFRKRERFTHKGDYGKCLLISGSIGKMGAAVLAAKAALRSGSGLLTVHAPRCGYTILQASVPEAMASPDEDEKHFSAVPDLEGYDVVGIGPGLGTDEITLSAYAKLLSKWRKPMVIDADGLNLIAKNHHLLDMVPKESIFTPHPKEFDRLAGETTNSFERLEKLKSYAQEHGMYVLLKGYHTAIATPKGKVYFNNNGNPGMATGGTGDVLTGIITSLLGQRYTPEQAVLLGAYLHGLAGDKAAEELGMDSLIASDVVEHLHKAFKELA